MAEPEHTEKPLLQAASGKAICCESGPRAPHGAVFFFCPFAADGIARRQTKEGKVYVKQTSSGMIPEEKLQT